MACTEIWDELDFVIFQADFADFVAFFLIKKKSKLFSNYRLFLTLFKTQKGCKILTLRSDVEDEYDNTLAELLGVKWVRSGKPIWNLFYAFEIGIRNSHSFYK